MEGQEQLLVDAFEKKNSSALAEYAVKTFGDEKTSIQFFSQILSELRKIAQQKANEALALVKEVEEQTTGAAGIEKGEEKKEAADGRSRNDRNDRLRTERTDRRALEDSKRKAKDVHPVEHESKKIRSTDLDFMKQDTHALEAELFMLLPDNTIGPIIGKGGASIKGIIRKTGAKVEIERAASWSDGTMRMIYFSGNLKSITQAQHEAAALSEVDFITILLPNSICGVVIGKGGSHIKQLEKDTGATLKIQPEDEDNVRKIQIHGGLRERTHAQHCICKIMAQDQRRGHFDPRDRDPNAYPSHEEPQRMHMMDQRGPYNEVPMMNPTPIPNMDQQAQLQMQMQNEQQMLQALYQQQLQQQQALGMAQQQQQPQPQPQPQQPQFPQQAQMQQQMQQQALQQMQGVPAMPMQGQGMMMPTQGQGMMMPMQPGMMMPMPMAPGKGGTR